MQYYNTEVMKRLGYMIEYKRNDYLKTDKKWKVGNFLRVTETNMICDWKTYQKIKDGIIVSDDLIYDELIEALGYSSTGILEIIELVDQLGRELMVPIDYYDVKKIAELCENTKIQLMKYPKGFLVDDYIVLMDEIVDNYQQGQRINTLGFQRLKAMFLFLDTQMQFVLLDLMYQHVARYIRDKKVANEFIEAYDFENNEEKFLRIYYCENLIRNQRISLAQDCYKSLLEQYKAENNTVKILILSMKLFNLHDGLFNREYYFYYDEIENILENCADKIPDKIIRGVYYELGMYFYCNKYYEEAYKYLEYCYSIDISRFFRCYIFCQFINSKTELDKIVIDKHFIPPLDRNDGIYYQYFLLKELDTEIGELEKYIIKSIKPTIDPNDFYYEIFTFELIQLVEITHHYKLLKFWNLGC